MSINAENGSAQKRVLIVEDDEHIALLLEYMLMREDFVAVKAADGRQAERIIESEAPPALVVLDYMLPYRSGLELIGMIRASQTWKNVPVMMLSAKSQEQDIVTCLDAGVSDYMVKPFQVNEFMARVRRMMREAK